MSEPGSYEQSIEMSEDISLESKKRLVRDSDGQWHTLEQSIHILGAFDRLTGLRAYDGQEPFEPDFNMSRKIVDEAVFEAKQSGLPLNICFQTIVMRLEREQISEIIRKESESD